MLFLKLILIILFGLIFYQDYKERQVYWFLFPMVGLICGFLFYSSTLPELFVSSIILNLAFISIMLCVIIIYSNLKLKKSIKEVIGLGDILLFLSFVFTFSTVSFLTIFVFGLMFSLVLHLILKHKQKYATVPLAGYLSLFFALSYILSWTEITQSLYTI